MNDSKSQTLVMIGVALLVIAGIMLYVSMSSPKVYESEYVVDDPSVVISASTDVNKETTTQVIIVPNESVSYPINLNTATYEEIISIEGIGERRANLILEYRDYIGGYSYVEQLMDIEGIGENVFEQISPYFTV